MNMVTFVHGDYTLYQNPSRDMNREIRHDECRRDMFFVPVITFQFMAENSPLALSAPSRKSLPIRQNVPVS